MEVVPEEGSDEALTDRNPITPLPSSRIPPQFRFSTVGIKESPLLWFGERAVDTCQGLLISCNPSITSSRTSFSRVSNKFCNSKTHTTQNEETSDSPSPTLSKYTGSRKRFLASRLHSLKSLSQRLTDKLQTETNPGTRQAVHQLLSNVKKENIRVQNQLLDREDEMIEILQPILPQPRRPSLDKRQAQGAWALFQGLVTSQPQEGLEAEYLQARTAIDNVLASLQTHINFLPEASREIKEDCFPDFFGSYTLDTKPDSQGVQISSGLPTDKSSKGMFFTKLVKKQPRLAPSTQECQVINGKKELLSVPKTSSLPRKDTSLSKKKTLTNTPLFPIPIAPLLREHSLILQAASRVSNLARGKSSAPAPSKIEKDKLAYRREARFKDSSPFQRSHSLIAKKVHGGNKQDTSESVISVGKTKTPGLAQARHTLIKKLSIVSAEKRPASPASGVRRGVH